MKRFSLLLTSLSLSFAFTGNLQGQALPTAAGPGSYISAGASVSAYQTDYGQRVIGGPAFFVDVHPSWRYGFEAEARYLRYRTSEDVTQTTYMAGPHVYAWKRGRLRVYGKFLVGQAKMNFPFGYGQGSYLAYAPGGGVDYELNNYVSVRAVDFEYQSWPKFEFGSLHPYGISVGLTVRLNPIRTLPRHKYSWR